VLKSRIYSNVIIIVLLCYSMNAYARHFQAPLHLVKWKLKKTNMECRLQQNIPFYGRAVFTNHAIYGFGFFLQTKRKLVVEQTAVVRSMPSDWQHDEDVRELADITMRQGKVPLKLVRDLSVTLLAELEQGKFPTFYFIDAPGPSDQVSVAISAVKFLPAFERFVACGNKLARFKFKKIRNRTVYFETAKHRINTYSAKRLDEIAAYILNSEKVSLIRINGHTDIVGGFSYNMQLSKRRANSVRKYLLQRKVPAHMIKTRHFGKVRPVSSNRTKKGRSRNRRAKIRLSR